MENQNNINSQNTQQTQQKILNKSVRSSEKIKESNWIFLTSLFLTIFFVVGSLILVNNNKKILSNQKSVKIKQTNETSIIGVLRTSGLSKEEKQQFDLKTVDYQVTDFEDDQKFYKEGKVMGYYLLSNTIGDKLLGKCIRVIGTVPQGWENKNKVGVYNRLVLDVTKIEKIDNLNCNPYPQTQPVVDNTQEKLILRGTIVHGKRPASDINYDYQLKLVEPFVDKFDPSGQRLKPQDVIDIVPTDNSTWVKLENNINEELEVEGYMTWGYSESRYLRIININEDSLTQAINIIREIPAIQTIEKLIIKAQRKPFYASEGESGDAVKDLSKKTDMLVKYLN